MSFRLWPEDASAAARQIDALCIFLTAVSAFFVAVIALAIVYFCAKYRAGSVADRAPLAFPVMRLEIAWTVFPLLLTMVMFGWGATLYFDLQRPPADALEIVVVGKQWMWKVQHAPGAREINELHVPLGRAVKLTMTSQDVIHSFYIPAFRVKQDVVPGRYTTEWFKPTRLGTYHLFCAEFCGTAHSQMIGRVVVMEPADYASWLSGGGEAPAVAGERLYNSLGCASCHNPGSPVHSPPLAGLFGRKVQLRDGRIVTADEGYIRNSLVNPQADIVAGYEPMMPTFQNVVNEEQILQLIAYMKSLVGKPPEPAK